MKLSVIRRTHRQKSRHAYFSGQDMSCPNIILAKSSNLRCNNWLHLTDERPHHWLQGATAVQSLVASGCGAAPTLIASGCETLTPSPVVSVHRAVPSLAASGCWEAPSLVASGYGAAPSLIASGCETLIPSLVASGCSTGCICSFVGPITGCFWL